MKKIFYIFTPFFILISFFANSQSYNDGPVNIKVKLREVQGNFTATDEALLGIGFAPDELTFKIWTQDNLGTYPWTGGQCLQDNNFVPTLSGANSIDFNTIIADFNFTSSLTPQFLDFRIDAWEDDLPSDQLIGFCNTGTPCTWQDVECCGVYLFGLCIGIETGDDYRCDANPFLQGLNYRLGPPCQWYSHGYINGSGCNNPSSQSGAPNTDGYYKPHIETYWQYTKGNSFSNSIDLGVLSSGITTHFNSNECYNDYYSASSGQDVIYSFRVNNPTGVNISLCGTNGAQFDSYLYLIKDTNLVSLSSNDNACGYQSEISTSLCDTGIYYIVVDATSPTELGTFTLFLTEDLSSTFSYTNNSIPTSCNGYSDGKIYSYISGGAAPFTFNWYDDNMTLLTSNNSINYSDSLINLQAGIYFLHVLDDDNCILIDTITITQPSPIQITTLSNDVSCNGLADGSASVSASGGNPPYYYSWNTIPNQSGSSAFFLSAGNYILEIIDSKSCTDSSVVVIQEPPPVPVAITNTTNNICAGGSINLTSSGANSYTWNPNIWLNTNFGNSVIASPNSSITYFVTGTDLNGCSNTDSININIIPSLNVSYSPSNPVTCDGESITINLQGASSYAWIPSTGVSQTPATPGTSFLVSPQTTTQYQIIATDNFGCVDSLDIEITVLSKPSVGISSNLNICEGSSIPIVATGANNYSWYPSTGLSSTIGSVVTCSAITSTTYNVIGYASNGCTDTVQTTISVNPNPTLTTFPNSITSCQGDTISAFVSGANNYIWSPSLGLNSNSSDTVLISLVSSLNYTILGIDSLGCSSSIDLNVQVNPLPSISIMSSNNPICFGDQINLFANGGVNYSWYPASAFNNNTGSIVSSIPSNNTMYSVIGTDVNNCSNSDTMTIIVNPLPLVSVSPNISVICEGESVQLDAFGADSYLWTPALGLNTTVNSSVVATPLQTTNYFVTGTNYNGCSDIVSTLITVHPKPNLSIFPSEISVCEGASIPITVFGANSYTWSPSNGLSSNNGSTVIASPQSSTTYIINAIDSNNCSNVISSQINIGISPQLQISPVNPQICEGEAISITVNGADQYIWEPANSLSSSVGSIIVAEPTINTSYTVIGTDTLGCLDSLDFTINVIPKPNADIRSSSGGTICSGESGLITIDLNGNPPWDINYTVNGNAFQNSTSDNPYLIYTDIAGTYLIASVTDANGCSNTGTGSSVLNILNSPIGSFTANPEVTDVLDPEVSFIDYSVYANSWIWNFGDNTFSNEQNPVHYYELPGKYNVTLVVSNDFCTDSIASEVIVNPIFTLYIPDAFTPNGDNLNDIFLVKGLDEGIDDFQIYIYNRWGQNVFYSDDINIGWDGTLNGKMAPTGFYSFIILVKDAMGTNHEIKDNILLE